MQRCIAVAVFLGNAAEGFASRSDSKAATVRMWSKEKFKQLELSFVANNAGWLANVVLEQGRNAFHMTDKRGAQPDDGNKAK